LLFWLSHIGLGMLLAIAATALLGGWMAGTSAWLRVCAGGVLGSFCFAPLALGLEVLAPLPALPETADGVLDLWEQQGGPLAWLAEWLQLAPSYLSSWLLINAAPLASAPSLHNAAQPLATTLVAPLRASVRVADPVLALPATAAAWSGLAEAAPGPDPKATSVDACKSVLPLSPHPALDQSRLSFLRQLPPAIGTDVVSIRADLHYLQVRTVIGRAIVLGSIATAERALGSHGLRVHRSWWVAVQHVRRVARGSTGWYCQLSDGSRIPVSRRRAGAVREHLGLDFVLDTST
jgi:hypothetical protein